MDVEPLAREEVERGLLCRIDQLHFLVCRDRVRCRRRVGDICTSSGRLSCKSRIVGLTCEIFDMRTV